MSVRIFSPRYSRDQLVEQLRGYLPALARALPLRRVVLFGSWATGRATAFSDIDLLVVHAGTAREDAYALVRKLVPIRGLEPHVYAEADAAAAEPMIGRMTRDGIVLI